MSFSQTQFEAAVADLIADYFSDPKLAASNIKNAEVFVETDDPKFAVLPINKVLSKLEALFGGLPKLSSQETLRKKQTMAQVGYVLCDVRADRFESLWAQYIATCDALQISPSQGAHDEKARRSFFVRVDPALDFEQAAVLAAFVAYDPDKRPLGFGDPRSWYVIDPNTDQPRPAKIIYGLATGQTGNDFTSHQARNALNKMGFETYQAKEDIHAILPDQLIDADPTLEAETRQVTRNLKERNPIARQKCIDHYLRLNDGRLACVACDLDFAERYGALGNGFIHIHHLDPIADATGPRHVIPEKDLVPVCPNCHAMIHRKSPPLTIAKIRSVLAKNDA